MTIFFFNEKNKVIVIYIRSQMEALYLKLKQMFIPKIKLSEENVYIKRKHQEITQQTFYQQIENTYKLWNQKN